MTSKTTQRYCASPQVLATLARDGIGWGHDLECGAFTDVRSPRRPSATARLFRAFRKGQ